MHVRRKYANQPVKRYMPGLDGLRALSVLAVIAYHMDLGWAKGGLLGVGVFFVISGYLITDQILMEWKKQGRIHLLKFWVRRIRRLLPAMIVMLMLVALWLLFIDTTRLQALKGEFLTSLFYVNNWWLIFHDVSYFESFGPPSPIGHLWSLAIEEQFYLLWPIILAIGLKRAPYRGKILLWIVGGAAASAIAMALIYVPGTDPSRVYYGTDTRAFALLIGAALAVVWPSWRLSGKISVKARRWLDFIGILGICVLIVLIVTANKFDDSLYRGGFLSLSLITAAVIAVLAHPASLVGKMMGCQSLRWIGVRSYSLYLWHYPVIILTNPNVTTEGSSFMRIMLQLAASFILAALSYKYVEEPLRRGRFEANRGHSRQYPARRSSKRSYVLAALPLFLLFSILWSMNLNQTEPEKSAPVVAVPEGTHNEHTEPNSDKFNIQSGEGITVIGDSVMVGVSPFLEEALPGIIIDGEISRQMRDAQEVVDRLQVQGKLGDRIIIALGSNGPFHAKTLGALLHSLSDKQVLLVNTKVPKEWQDIVNRTISDVADNYGNATVVDWYSASEGKHDYFTPDGVHLTVEGSKYYASMLSDAIRNAN